MVACGSPRRVDSWLPRLRWCASGRAGATPCCAKAMAVASTAPIQMGRYRSPAVSFSNTIGWLEGSSTRTPTTVSSFTRHSAGARDPNYTAAPVTEPLKLAAEKGAQPGLHQDRVQSHRQRPELPRDLFSATARLRISLSHKGCDDLLHEAYFTIGGCAKSPKV